MNELIISDSAIYLAAFLMVLVIVLIVCTNDDW